MDHCVGAWQPSVTVLGVGFSKELFPRDGMIEGMWIVGVFFKEPVHQWLESEQGLEGEVGQGGDRSVSPSNEGGKKCKWLREMHGTRLIGELDVCVNARVCICT